MSPSSQSPCGKRASRVKLAGTVLALVQLENGRQIRARLHQLSMTGGLLHLETPLDEGINVEIIFHLGSCTVRSKAVIVFPMWATQGCLQPFEFADLAEEHRHQLETEMQKLLGQAAGGNSPHEDAFEASFEF
jgi:hypothetical protein